MKQKNIKLVGILVLNDKVDNKFSINNVSLARKKDGSEDVLTQLGIRYEKVFPYTYVVRGLCNAYAGTLRNVWIQPGLFVDKTYLQLTRTANPGQVGLEGGWIWTTQR